MRRVLLGTLIVGALDITEVILFYWLRSGVRPTRILQSVAAGIYGREAAIAGGTRTALAGLALHYFIAFIVVLIYYLASRRFPLLRERPVVMGALYGLAVYAVMTYAVVPASAIGPPKQPPAWPALANALFAHIFCIGIPTGLVSKR